MLLLSDGRAVPTWAEPLYSFGGIPSMSPRRQAVKRHLSSSRYAPYPPSTAAALSPLALLPEPVARHVWLTISLFVLYLGVWCAMRVIDPHWTINTRLLLLGCVACAGSVRWSVFQYQAAVMVAGLLGIFLYAELKKRNVLSLLCALLITIKFSLLGPVLLLWLFRRQYRKIALLVVLAVVINVGATARTRLCRDLCRLAHQHGKLCQPGIQQLSQHRPECQLLAQHPLSYGDAAGHRADPRSFRRQ